MKQGLLIALLGLLCLYAYGIDNPALPQNIWHTDSYGRWAAKGDSALVWDEIVVIANSVRKNPTSTKPDYDTWLFPGQTYLFDAAAPESVYFDVEIPHDWLIGDPIECHVHHVPLSDNTGAIAWKLFYMMTDINGTFAFGAGDTLSVRQAGSGTAYKHQLANLGSVDMTSITSVSSIISCVLVRDADKKQRRLYRRCGTA